MATDYPNPYDSANYENYEDPYSENGDSYSSGTDYNQSYDQTSYNSHTNNDDNYGSEDSYGAYSESYSTEGNYSEQATRNGEQEERDRQQRKNRSERRREIRSGGHSRHRDSSRNRDRDRYDRDRRDRDSDDRAGEKWVTETPSNTIILQKLPGCIEEKDIKAELMLFGAPIRDVRLMRKSSGASRGFAFVEFQNRDDAVRWMDSNQKKLMLQNQYTCTMNYSTPKDPKDKQMMHRMDWTCVKCGVHNFKRRDYCFKCNMSRYESGKSQADGYDHVGTNPCNTLVLRGLDASTTEESILRALNAVIQLTCKNIQVVRDVTTQASQGFAFVEVSSVAESVNVLEVLKQMNPPLEIDGKQILVAFAKNTFTTSIATIAAAQQSWDQSSEYYQNYEYNQFDQSGYYSGQYYDGQNYEYSGYYSSESGDTATTSTSVDSTNAAAAVAQAAIQQAKAAKHYQKQVQQQQKIAEMSSEEKLAQQAQAWKQAQTDDTTSTTQEYAKYPPPDVSLYQYDETSGYYYDPVTGLYYDGNSQYYYNSQTGQFMYWDAEKSTYLPAPTDDASTEGKDKKEDKKEGKDKKEKVKVAKKIAKDMEKWAKSMNAQKEAVKDGIKKINMPNLSGRKESATADAGFAILEKVKNESTEDKKLMPPPPMPGGGTPTSQESGKHALVASYGGDSDDEEEDDGSAGVDESKLLDTNKMACLLCKRQFQSKDQLMRHAQMSDLHKQNLEALRQSHGKTSPGGTSNMQYRDRAKERREKIGSLAPPARKRPPPPPEPFEQPTKAGLGADNIGSKMLQKMGWSSGQGLGRSGQGIVNPIEAERRNQSAGLGMRGSKTASIDGGDDYKVALKKTLFARYNELE